MEIKFKSFFNFEYHPILVHYFLDVHYFSQKFGLSLRKLAYSFLKQWQVLLLYEQ